MSPFDILGIPRFSNTYKVKEKWRQLAAIYHPDKETGDAVKFNEFRKAYKKALELSQRPRNCPQCKGSGKLKDGSGVYFITMNCHACKGSGRI